jgi:hypothetical protein
MKRPTYLHPGEFMRPLRDKEALSAGTLIVTRFGKTGGQRAIVYANALREHNYVQARKWSNKAQQWTKTVRIVQRPEIRGVIEDDASLARRAEAIKHSIPAGGRS